MVVNLLYSMSEVAVGVSAVGRVFPKALNNAMAKRRLWRVLIGNIEMSWDSCDGKPSFYTSLESGPLRRAAQIWSSGGVKIFANPPEFAIIFTLWLSRNLIFPSGIERFCRGSLPDLTLPY